MRLIHVAAVALAALIAGCSGTFPAAPRQVASPDYNYLIGPLDNLNIQVWRNPDLSTTVPVRPDGKVTVPLVEDIPVLGKNSTQLARDIEKQLAKYIRDPVVTVIVTGFTLPHPGPGSAGSKRR